VSVEESAKKFTWQRGFWGMAVFASLLLFGLIGATIVGAVNPVNRDDQITSESQQITKLKKEISNLNDQYSDARGDAKACANAYYYSGMAYNALRDALVNQSMTAGDIAEINQYITEAKNAGCGTGGASS
jgi:hypothetical protein